MHIAIAGCTFTINELKYQISKLQTTKYITKKVIFLQKISQLNGRLFTDGNTTVQLKMVSRNPLAGSSMADAHIHNKLLDSACWLTRNFIWTKEDHKELLRFEEDPVDLLVITNYFLQFLRTKNEHESCNVKVPLKFQLPSTITFVRPSVCLYASMPVCL